METKRAATKEAFRDIRYRTLITRLVEEREFLGLSQQAVADKLGWEHQSFVSRYELGDRRLDVAQFCDVCWALGLVPSEVIETFF